MPEQRPGLTVFSYPFRIFFLSTALWALLAVLLWWQLLLAPGSWQPALAPLLWHQHEMLFGLLTPAIAGFLLTAVCVWTQSQRLHGAPLIGLFLVWLAGRLILAWGGEESLWLGQAINLLFLPLVMLDAGRRVWAARQWRQLPLLLILLLLWLAQASLLLAGTAFASQLALLAAAALMLEVGGRITPPFSSNWLRQRGLSSNGISNPAWLTHLTRASLLILIVVRAAEQLEWLPGSVGSLLFALLAAGLSAARILLWRGWRVAGEPLLWILHLSLAWIPLALLLLAGASIGLWADTVWLHALALGAMASLILGVMARVSLGHTGRPLLLPAGMVSAFWLIQAGAVLRVLTALHVLPWSVGISLTALCWLLAFALFLLRYTSILWRPRADGQEG